MSSARIRMGPCAYLLGLLLLASAADIDWTEVGKQDRREHGVNERISTQNLREGTRRLFEVLPLLDTEDQHDGQIHTHTP